MARLPETPDDVKNQEVSALRLRDIPNPHRTEKLGAKDRDRSVRSFHALFLTASTSHLGLRVVGVFCLELLVRVLSDQCLAL